MLATLALVLAQAVGTPQPKAWEHELVQSTSWEDSPARERAVGDVGPAGATALVLDPGRARRDEPSAPGRPGPPEASFESPPIAVAAGFDELLPSWNVACDGEAGFRVEVRVARAGQWSPWLEIGNWGAPLPAPAAAGAAEFDGVRVAIDVLESSARCDQASYRIRAASEGGGVVRVCRFALCFSRRIDVRPAESFELPPQARRRLAVPFRSQKSEAPELAARICSPTSVAMVLGYRGVDLPTAQVAERLFDAEHDIYGNWNRALQGAFSLGVPGYLARFSDWNAVAALIAAGQPLVISIAAAAGELDGAPYATTDGHLLVLAGFDERGDVCVNDPAAADGAGGLAVYRRGQLERVWMARGGTAYVLLPPGR